MAQMKMKFGAKKKSPTAYNRLQKVKKAYCEGKKTKADVTKAANAYIKTTVAKKVKAAAKGNKVSTAKKATAAAKKTANRVLKGGCKMSSAVGKTKGSRRKK